MLFVFIVGFCIYFLEFWVCTIYILQFTRCTFLINNTLLMKTFSASLLCKPIIDVWITFLLAQLKTIIYKSFSKVYAHPKSQYISSQTRHRLSTVYCLWSVLSITTEAIFLRQYFHWFLIRQIKLG